MPASDCVYLSCFVVDETGCILTEQFSSETLENWLALEPGTRWYETLREGAQLGPRWKYFAQSDDTHFSELGTRPNEDGDSGAIPISFNFTRAKFGGRQVFAGIAEARRQFSDPSALEYILDTVASLRGPTTWGHFAFWPASREFVLGKSWRSTLGLDEFPATLSEKEFLSLVHEDDLPSFRQALAEITRGEIDGFETRARIRCIRGMYRWAQTWWFHLKCSFTGQIDKVIGITADSNKLRFQREFLSSGASLLEHVQESVIATDLEGTIWFWGRGAEQLYGWRSDEVLGRSVFLIVPEHSKEVEEERMRAVQETGHWYGRYQQVRKNGSTFTAETYIALIRNFEGEPIGFVGIDHDISERVAAQRQIANLQGQLSNVGWMNVRGELLAGISHEINQPLYAIQNFATAAKKHLERGDLERSIRLLDKVTMEVSRANKISDSMREFAKKSELQLTEKDIHEVLGDCAPFASLYAESLGVLIGFDYDADCVTVMCDPLHLQQAVLNLIRNACEALSELDRPKKVTVGTWNNSHTVYIDVQDNGSGIDEKYVERIFDHFFSTKQQGTGVGLPLCRSVVSAHGGELKLVSTSPAGTIFRIGLPHLNR